jgi:outer membrane protein TolC
MRSTAVLGIGGAAVRAVAVLALAAGGLGAARTGHADEPLKIDLATALRLADERNLDVAIYYQRVAAASAALTQARLLAVPTIRAGAAQDQHHGTIQEVAGTVIDADRASRFTGVGAGLSVNIADAIFQPLAARQNLDAVRASANVNRHQVLVDVATAYLGLLRARAAERTVAAALERANDLAALTASYASSGEGLLADAQMAAVQPLYWQQQALAARESVEAATAAVIRLLHLDPGVAIEPTEETIPTLELYPADESLDALVARALDSRPEREQLDALVASSEESLKAQRYGILIPSVSLTYQTGQFGGAPGSSIENVDHRDDLNLQLYWQLDGFGFGHRARVVAQEAQLREIGLRRDKLRDAIAAEVRSAYASTQSRRAELPLAAAAVTRATDAYALHRERIYDRLGLPLEALAAMQSLATAELASIDTVVSYDLAQIRLHTALGNPLENPGP